MDVDRAAQLREAKRVVRAEARARRRALSPDAHATGSTRAASSFIDLDLYRRARLVLAFAAFGDEIDTVPLLRRILADGKHLVLPATVTGQRDLELRLVTDLATLRPGLWGIPEPGAGSATVGPGDLDLVIAPGLAFDERGYRVGYGGGYYDRLLRRIRGRPGARAVACGFAFEVQVWPEIPAGPRDERLDWLVTDVTVRQFAGGGAARA